jgi:lysophospholipase L1-like esterase
LNVAIKEISTYYDNVYLVEPSLDINHYNEKYLEWGDVHPNKDGYEKLTESFVKAIKKHTKLTIQW